MGYFSIIMRGIRFSNHSRSMDLKGTKSYRQIKISFVSIHANDTLYSVQCKDYTAKYVQVSLSENAFFIISERKNEIPSPV